MSADLIFILLLALRMAVAAIFVVTASVVTERSGPVIGALIATLPISAGPAYVFLALDHDAAFIAEGALASLAAIVFELGASKGSPAGLALAIVTITLSWALVHTAFALHYAHEYYRGKTPGGLQFPSGEEHVDADYWDFVYFSFVIGMTAQVSDVGITDKIIRRTATVHGIISFMFNTALLALMVNIAASAI